MRIKDIQTSLYLAIISISLAHSQGIPIGYDSDEKDYDVLKGQLEGYRVFMDGESHNVSSNEARHFNLFRFLYRNYGVRYYIKEYDFQWGFSVNRYIQTGDEEWIKKGTPSREADEYYRALLAFNKTLPAGEKLLFISIDAYGFRNTSDFIDKLIAGKGEPPKAVQDVLVILRGIRKTETKGMGMDIRGKDKESIMEKLHIVREQVQNNAAEFSAFFGDDYIFFHLLVFNKASERRSDKNLAENFLTFVNFFPMGNYYMHYGNLHCQLNKGWLAAEINRRESFQGKVCSFTSQYRDSEYWFYDVRRETDFGIVNSGNYSEKIIDKLLESDNEKCTLHKASDIGFGLEKGTHYIFFLRDQKAMESYYKKEP